jgi:hypothetical protein
MPRFDHVWGQAFAARTDNRGEKILAEVIGRSDCHDVEVIKEAADAERGGLGGRVERQMASWRGASNSMARLLPDFSDRG